MKEVIQRSQKYETIAIGIVQFYNHFASEQVTIDTQTAVNVYLKNLIFNVHQNYLILCKIVLSRTLQTNSFSQRLHKAVMTKALKQINRRGECLSMLEVYCSAQENILRNICKSNNNKKLFKTVQDWLNQIKKVPISRIREVLSRLDNFRADALVLPNLQAEAPVYGAGAKSAGSLGVKDMNKTQKGRTALTGKNPFAILKASAIASCQPASFPNNFQNLPKASPPFLGAIENGKEYCLVLDLDETLIHNVDIGNESYFLTRPGCVEFIQTLAKYYELVIFTAATQEYADQVID